MCHCIYYFFSSSSSSLVIFILFIFFFFFSVVLRFFRVFFYSNFLLLGLCNFRKRRTIFLWCRKCKADLVFLQETHSIAATENQWRNEWGAEMISCHGSSNERGVAILFKNGIDCSIIIKL